MASLLTTDERPQNVNSSYFFAAPKKDEKANPFLSNYFKV